MYSHFLKKFLREALHFSGCWLFLKKWNNESVVINITPHLILTPPIQVYPPTNVRKIFVSTKLWQICKLSSPHYNGGYGETKPTSEKRIYKYLWYAIHVLLVSSFILSVNKVLPYLNMEREGGMTNLKVSFLLTSTALRPSKLPLEYFKFKRIL